MIKLEISLEELATITELPPKEREELRSLLATFEEASNRGAVEAPSKNLKKMSSRADSTVSKRYSGNLSDVPTQTHF